VFAEHLRRLERTARAFERDTMSECGAGMHGGAVPAGWRSRLALCGSIEQATRQPCQLSPTHAPVQQPVRARQQLLRP
jgi:hypothetical protein